MAGKPTGRYTAEFWAFIETLGTATWEQKAAAASAHFGTPYTGQQIRQQARRMNTGVKSAPAGNPGRTMVVAGSAPEPLTIEEKIAQFKATSDADSLRAENRDLIARLSAKDREVEAALRIAQTPQEFTLKVKPTKKLRTTQVILWSDWHVDEVVKSERVSGLNEFNQQIADQRIQSCISNTARLMEVTGKDAPVDATVLQLGGDFISGNIHAELAENTWAPPIDAMLWVQDRLMAGVRHIAERTPKLVVVCNIGNHSRITHKTHISTAQANSLEYFTYHNMRHSLRDVKNIEWVIAEGYHVYVDLYGHPIRFHHGDMIKYGGGVGGIFIPANKAISQWDKARPAALDCFGHFHQLKNGGKFICNGSLIGYNAFAVAIKADFERPYQKFFLFTNTGEVCGEYPIFLD